MSTKRPLSAHTRKRLHIQGYACYSDEALNQYKIGIRFAYGGCAAVVTLGLLLQSPLLWGVAMSIAFLAVLLPYHPFDYLYNYGIRFLLDKPPVPRRTNQAKFACGLATLWLGAVILLFTAGHPLTANVLVAVLLAQAWAVSTIDFCIPSMIYNMLNRIIGSKRAGIHS